MTMMALTRKRHRALHLWALALALVLVAAIALGLRGSRVEAIAEGDVQFSVTQSPSAGSTVQVGSTLRLDVSANVVVAPVGIPLYFEFDYPAGLTFTAGGSTPSGVTCTDNQPSAGVVRCSYGLVLAGPRVPVWLEFSVNASVTTTPAQVMIRGGDSDGAPDTAVDGIDDTFANAGAVTTFGPATIAVTGAPDTATAFEGRSLVYTATFQNNSGVATGVLGQGAAVLFTNATVTSIVCSHGSGGGLGNANATCNNPNIGAGQTLTITATVVAANSADGADIGATVSAPQLGISQSTTGVTVNEVGLDFTGTTLTTGTLINVCTALVPSDVPNDAAAGLAQTGTNAVVGTVSQNPLLNTGDFQVSGPGVGAVSAATGCAPNQSGVSFTPSAAGAYSVTALYNTGGSNTLSLTVGGPSSNPVPSAGALVPSSANAGSGGFTLTVQGSNFVNGSVVRWNGASLATTYLNATTLEAAVPGANIASAGSAQVTVFNPTPGGGTSNQIPFTINAAPNPVPTVSGLSPNSTAAGSPQFVLTVTGTNFVAGSVVRWNGADLATTFGSATSLTATVPAANVATAGAANITVFNPAPGGGVSVTPQAFTINPGAAKLAFTTQPGTGVAGSPLQAQPVVAVQTAANATVTSDSTTVVTLTLNGSGTLTCTGGLTKTVTAGVAAFAGCAVSQAGTGFTITASAAGLTSATSGAFDVSAAPPTPSAQITVSNPTNASIPRSRLSFAVSTGNLNATAVGFIIRRDSDDWYWNAATGEWQEDLVQNPGVKGSGSAWSLAVEGEARRAFAGTKVTLEARVTVGATIYVNQTVPELTIR